MPYQRRRARSCGAAMTDDGVSFVKELDESDAKECRWNSLLERGVRNDSTEQVYRIGKRIRLTQIRRDGVVRYACAEKGCSRSSQKIGHVISKPVPLREIDMELVEKNEANRKKEQHGREMNQFTTSTVNTISR
ncbi:unnamed protein product, partial [Mesorhabditis belari]|uniref:Uncharacterized protein n=1 Tax=Mesorhabditis belari TaxID=2138241 RepID=A0AAF3FMP0_9BILA